MKKIFTLMICAVFAIAAKAQVEFIHNGEVVADGATIEFHAEVLDLGGGFIILECAPNEPFVKNAGGSDANVTVTVEKTKPESDKLTWCGITSSCMPISGDSETRSATIAAGAQSPLALHADFEEGEYATYTAKVTAKAGLSAAKTIYIKFVYADAAGIEENAVADKVSINGKNLNYSFGTAAQRTLNVYGVSGRLMKSVKLGQNGSVSLNALPNGVYIYEVKQNGKRAQAHKFILR